MKQVESDLSFSAVEVEVLRKAIKQQIKSCNWDVTDERDWRALCALKNLEEGIESYLKEHRLAMYDELPL